MTAPTRTVRLLATIAVVAVLAAGLRRAVPRVLARFFRVRRVGLELGPSDFGLDAEDVTIAGPNHRTLKGWFVASPGTDRTRPTVLVIHGWNSAASLMLPVASLVHDAGAHALFLDARCHGRSDEDGFASMPRFAEDVDAGLRWLRDDPRVEPAASCCSGTPSVPVRACSPRVAIPVSRRSSASPRWPIPEPSCAPTCAHAAFPAQ